MSWVFWPSYVLTEECDHNIENDHTGDDYGCGDDGDGGEHLYVYEDTAGDFSRSLAATGDVALRKGVCFTNESYTFVLWNVFELTKVIS